MKNLLALIGLAVVLVGGLGWYLKWFEVGAQPNGAGHTKINVDVNTDKIKQDVQAGEKKLSGYLNSDQKSGASTAKSVVGTPTGLKLEKDGSFTIDPGVLPPLIPPPAPVQTGTVPVVPPPPGFNQ